MWKQKSKDNNLRFGDRNTKYFHTQTLRRRRRNRILSIIDNNGNNLDTHKEISDTLTAHFKEIATSPGDCDVEPILSLFEPVVSLSENERLIAIPSARKIANLVKGMAADKSPGPDGFNLKFYQHHCPVIESDVIK